MRIKKILVEDFASYQELKADEMDKGCNLILGKNGCGKSNLFEAIIFALGDSFKNLSKQEKRKFLHEGTKSDKRDNVVFAVEITLCNAEKRIPVEADELTVRKTYNTQTDREDYHLNGKHIRQKELFNLFESGGFSMQSASQFQIIKQGKVQQLVEREDSGFLEMLCEVTGTAAFDDRLSKMLAALGEAALKKESLRQILSEIEMKLEGLSVDKETYSKIENIEIRKKAYSKALYVAKIAGYEQQVSNLRQEKSRLMQDREVMIQKREEQMGQTNEQRQNVEQLREQITRLEQKIDCLQMLRSDLMKKQIESQAMITQTFDQRSFQQNFESQFGAQMKSLESGMLGLKKQAEDTSAELNTLQVQFEKINAEQNSLAQEKDLLLMRKHTAEQLQNPHKRALFFDQEIQKLKLTQSLNQKEQGDAQKNEKLVSKQVQEIKDKMQQKDQEMQQAKLQMAAATTQMETARQAKKSIATLVKQKIFEMNEAELQCTAAKTKLAQNNSLLEKSDGSYCSLRRLIAQLQGTPGFYGIFLDQLDIKNAQQFSAVVDIAGRSKLFSLIVDTTETAKKVLEVNKTINGSQISIFPIETLDLIETKHVNFSAVSVDVKPLIDFVALKVTADQRLQKLVQNTFSKVVLVRDYQTALQVARDNNLTCVTPDLQVVYKGAFITKVGSQGKSQSENRVALYQRISLLQLELHQKSAQLAKVQLEQSHLSQEDLDGLRVLQRCEGIMTHLRQQQAEISGSTFELRSQLDQRTCKLQDHKATVVKYEQLDQGFEEQLKALEIEKASKGVFSDKDLSRLQFLNKQISKLGMDAGQKLQIIQLLRQQQEKQNKLLQHSFLKKKTELEDQHNQNLVNETVNQLKTQDHESLVNQQGANLAQLKQSQNDLQILQQKLDSCMKHSHDGEEAIDDDGLVRLRARTREVEVCGQKIDEVLMMCQDNEALIQKLGRYDDQTYQTAKNWSEELLLKGIREAVKELESFPRKNRHSTDWHDKYEAKYKDLQVQTDLIEQTEQGIRNLLTTIDKQRQKAIEENFLKMNENFAQIFSRIVPGGTARLKLVATDVAKESQKSDPSQFPDGTQVFRLAAKSYKGIKVSVAFDGEAEETNLKQLSGGQKSVVVVAMIFAVLKMEAAPFYILDEFDHALDSQYRQAIANLISELSVHSQFLITTFKPELLQVMESTASMYEVTFKNRKSTLKPIEIARAFELLKK